MSNCMKHDPEWGNACCCTCRWRLTDYSHPNTDGGHVRHKRGYICAPPEFLGHAFSGWSAHGLCEMHERRPRARRKTRPHELLSIDNLMPSRKEPRP